MRINNEGLSLIKSFESLSLKAYKDPVGIWTIGYGSTRDVKEGMTITQDEAEQRLLEDLKTAELGVSSSVKVPLNENQFSALVSFTFNVGVGNLSQSTLLSWLNKSDYYRAADCFLFWVYAKKIRLPGLVKRREAERTLFLKGI
jgi:lysozyme